MKIETNGGKISYTIDFSNVKERDIFMTSGLKGFFPGLLKGSYFNKGDGLLKISFNKREFEIPVKIRSFINGDLNGGSISISADTDLIKVVTPLTTLTDFKEYIKRNPRALVKKEGAL